MIFVVKYPLVPAQISLVSMFTIGLPGFLLSQAPNRDLIKGHFVTNILKRAIPGGLASAFLIAVMMLVGSVFNIGEADASTACTIIIAVVGMFMVARAAKPIDWYKKIVVWLCAIGLFLSYAFLPNVFNLTRMSFQALLICVALVALVKPVLDKMVQLTEWIWLVAEKFVANAKKYIQDNKIELVNPFQKD